jgi:hypothetical protein
MPLLTPCSGAGPALRTAIWGSQIAGPVTCNI